TFLAPTTVPTGHGPTFIATGDFNNDGHTDLAVTNKTDNTVSIFLGKGDGTFQNRVDYVTGNAPEWVSVADFNGDTIPDLAVANNTDNTVSILLGQNNTGSTTGNGTFSAKTDYPVGKGPTSIAVADYNIDGRPDLAVTDQTDNAVSLLLGAGDGTFGPNLELNVGTDPVSAMSADFNADGRPDLAVANFGSNTASVILNSSNFTTPNGLSGQPYPGVQYIDIGVKVKATPRIHLNDDVTLKLNFDLTTLTSTSFNGIPVIANQQLEQTVRVHDNQTASLAAFLAPQNSKSLGGAPGLATIPGAGLLAGTENVNNANTELLILITPHLVSLAPRKDQVIYAGRGSLQGPGAFGPTREERQSVPEEVIPEAAPGASPAVPPANPSEPFRTPNP
ncbi:MAG: FG-GAP-like repeat-containing protein, partial [Candidatus Binataceae bacterium]